MSTTLSKAVLITGCSTGIGAATAERLAPVAMDSVRRQFETNVFGLVRMCQLVLPGMRGQGWGKIVNLSSMGGKFTFPGGGFYHATKHAVESLSDRAWDAFLRTQFSQPGKE